MRRRRVFIAIGLLIALTFLVLVVLALIGPSHSRLLLLSVGSVRGDTEYCEYPATDQTHMRLAFTPYASSQDIDPNDWRDEPLSMDFMSHRVIVIPYFEYEISIDGGQTWEKFWTYENAENWYPSCEQFGKLDAETFWVWAPYGFAVTQDGGLTWLERDFRPEREAWHDGEIKIGTLTFQSSETGTISQGYPGINGPNYFTIDGGRSWQVDPSFATPTNELN